LERAGNGLNQNRVFGKTSESAAFPQEHYSLCLAMPFLLKPLYIIRRQITTWNAQGNRM